MLHNDTLAIQRPSRIAGILLVSSFLILLLALIILIASGAFPAFSAFLQGSLIQMAPYAATFRSLNLLWTVGWSILWLAGYLVGMGAPGVLFIMPAAIGVALLRG